MGWIGKIIGKILCFFGFHEWTEEDGTTWLGSPPWDPDKNYACLRCPKVVFRWGTYDKLRNDRAQVVKDKLKEARSKLG